MTLAASSGLYSSHYILFGAAALRVRCRLRAFPQDHQWRATGGDVLRSGDKIQRPASSLKAATSAHGQIFLLLRQMDIIDKFIRTCEALDKEKHGRKSMKKHLKREVNGSGFMARNVVPYFHRISPQSLRAHNRTSSLTFATSSSLSSLTTFEPSSSPSSLTRCVRTSVVGVVHPPACPPVSPSVRPSVRPCFLSDSPEFLRNNPSE